MRFLKTPGHICVRGGLAGAAAPDARTLRTLGRPDYWQATRDAWNACPPPSAPVLPDPAFLSSWATVDQRPRDTCTAFGAVAAVEMLRHAAAGTEVAPLSSQYLYWMMRVEHPLTGDDVPPGYDLGATRLSQARDVIEGHGLCPDALAPTWAALVDRTTAPEGAAPSDEARAAADPSIFAPGDYGFLPADEDRPAHNLSHRFHALLSEGRPIAAGFPMFGTGSGRSNWHAVDALSTGEVLGPLEPGSGIRPGSVARSGHVICILGYVPDEDDPGEGWFIFRNSWGVAFGQAGSRRLPDLPPGYGTISAGHVDQYCWEYYAPRLAGR